MAGLRHGLIAAIGTCLCIAAAPAARADFLMNGKNSRDRAYDSAFYADDYHRGVTALIEAQCFEARVAEAWCLNRAVELAEWATRRRQFEIVEMIGNKLTKAAPPDGRIFDINPLRAIGYDLLAQGAERRGSYVLAKMQYGIAIRLLEEAQAFAPDAEKKQDMQWAITERQVRLGYTLLALNDADGALAAFDKRIALIAAEQKRDSAFHVDHDVLLGKAIALMRKGRTDQADHFLKRAMVQYGTADWGDELIFLPRVGQFYLSYTNGAPRERSRLMQGRTLLETFSAQTISYRGYARTAQRIRETDPAAYRQLFLARVKVDWLLAGGREP